MVDDLISQELKKFLFATGLYKPVTFSEIPSLKMLEFREPVFLFEGYCHFCDGQSTFWSGFDKPLPDLDVFDYDNPRVVALLQPANSVFNLEIACKRRSDHTHSFAIKCSDTGMMKVGQWPSHADISLSRHREVLKRLSRDDKREFVKAVGLLSSDVGVGSFAYFRRILENLAQKEYEANKQELNVELDGFRGMRFHEKLALLKEYLPKFLTENKKIYSILSLGIHELSEQECKEIGPILEDAITTILIEAQAKLEKAERQKATSKAISEFNVS